MNKTLSFIAGAALTFTAGTASSAELLNDTQMDKVSAGVGFTSITFVQKLVDIQELIQEQKLALFQVVTEVQGWSAVAEAEADAEGPNADAQTFTFAEVEPFGNFGLPKVNSLAKSIALVSN